MVIMKVLFKLSVLKKSADSKKKLKNYPECKRVKSVFKNAFSAYQWWQLYRFGLNHHLCLYFVSAIRKGSDRQVHMGESFQDYSWTQDFEADFPQEVSLKILNYGDHNSFFDLFSVCLRTIDHLNLTLWIFSGHTASSKYGVLKVQDYGNVEISPMSAGLSDLFMITYAIANRISWARENKFSKCINVYRKIYLVNHKIYDHWLYFFRTRLSAESRV